MLGSEELFMGDIVKKNTTRLEKTSLEEKMERAAIRQKYDHAENITFDNLSKTIMNKDKLISARVNSSVYTTFRNICAKRGLSANAALNMLISDFVLDNKHVLEK